MPPTLDLNRTAHSNMTVTAPRINLRRAASYHHEKVPSSSTYARFSLSRRMFASPPPSPGLPTLSPPLKKRSRGIKALARPRRLVRLVLWSCGLLCFFCLLRGFFPDRLVLPPPDWSTAVQSEYEMVAQEHLPDFPTPIMTTDARGRARWTVSIPASAEFPLSMAQYTDMCAKCRDVAEKAKAMHSHGPGLPQTVLAGSLAAHDGYFLDVQEAERTGLLPAAMKGQLDQEEGAVHVCEKSITFVLESRDAGLGRALMMLWMAYGLAQKEGRAFFIDDTRWAYGKYTDIFLPPPDPGCRPPPSHERVPCPRQARHLVASAANAGDIFGRLAGDIADADTMDKTDRQTTLHLARRGYEALFRLNSEDGAYVAQRIQELRGQKSKGPVIGLHIRRGDRHPLEYQYTGSYIPLSTFADTARSLSHAANPTMILASDDPLAYEAPELSSAQPAQQRIKLASKAAIEDARGVPDRGVMRKYVDETFGWEGGFFAAMFWNLGRAQGAAVTGEVLRLRSLVGRAYVMDLAVLAGGTDVVVCTVSAMGCRMLGVMVGVERGRKWVNVEGEGRWRAGVGG